jgi:gamma-glutamyltranspeptidase/glutathione hydrolase
MVLKDGEPELVLGAAGGIRIISAVVQAVSRVIDDGLSLPEALAAPRVHPNIDPRTGEVSGLSVEAGEDDGWSPESVARFEGLGIEIAPTRFRGAFGRIHGIQYDAESGIWIGAADPDWEGAAVAPAADRRQ